MSLSANRLFYTNTNHNDASNTLINFHNLTGNAELNEHPLSKYARGIFFSPNYNKEFFDAINWANNLGDYKTQLNLINPFVNNVLMNIGLLNDNVVLSDQLIISHILQMGTPIDGEGQSGGGGQSVSCNGDGTIVAIGAHYNNGHAGSVRVYDYVKGRVPKEWEQLGDDIEAESGGNYSGWSVSLSNDGKIVAIGAYGNSDKGNRSGHVRVYDYVKDRVPKEWEQLGSDIDGNAGGEDFGKSVSLSADGTIVAIGGQGYSNFSFMGVVRIYQWNVSDWDQLGDDIYGESNGDWSGWSVSLNDGGTIVAIGAHFHDGKGHVRVYDYVKDRVPKEWDQLGSDIDAQASGEQFGWSVSLNSDGTIIAIGGRGHNSSTGVVRVFKYNGNIWEIIGTFDGESTSDELGRGVSLSSDGTILAIGAPHNGNKGQARIYQYLEGVYASDWIQVGYDIDGESTSDEFGHSVSLSKNGSVLHVSAPKYNNSNGRVYTYELVKNPITSVVKMGTPIDGQGTHDHCGYAVSSNADGTIIAISSHWYSYTDQSNYLRGRVRIYKWNNSSWNHIGTIDGEDKESNSGYSTSLSDDGTILAIGAPYNDGGGTGYGAGHVRVYDYIEGRSPEWDQLGSDIEGEAAYNFGGGSVSLNSNGTILAIGAKYNDVNTGDTNDNTGHVRVYEWNGINWDQLGADIDGEAAGDHSGYSVSLSSDGKIVAIGAERNSGNGNESGHVRVYDYDENRNPEWKQLGSDIDGEAAGNHSGISVSLSSDGTILAVGAPYNNGPANISSIGHVRVYQYVSGLYASDWVQVGYDLDGETETDLFGWSVSLSKNGSTLIVGAYQHDNIGNNSGRVYTYELIKQPITTMAVMGSPIDGDGGSFGGVSLNEDGTVLAIGAYQRSEDEVRVYKYDKIPDELPPSAMTTNETTINSEIFKVSASSEQPPSEPVIDWKWPAEHNVFVNDYHSDYDNGLTPIGGWGNQGRTDGYGVHGPANAGDPTKSSPYHSADYSGPITWRHVDLLFEFDSTAWVSGWRQVGAPGYIGHGDKKQYKSYVKDISVFISDQKDTRPDGAVRTGDTWVDTHESSNGWTYIGSYTHGVDQSGPHPNYTPISFPQSISTSTWEPVPCKYLIIRVESNWGDTYRGGILIIKEMQIKFGIPDTYSPSNAFNYILGTSYHQHYNLSKPYNNDEYTYQGGLDGSFYSTAGHDGEWLQIELPYKIILNKFTLTNSINWGGRMPKTGVVLGQNESSWDVVFTINDIYGAYAGIETRQFYVNNNKYYDTFRLVSTSLFGGDVHDTPSISDWRLFGVKETTKPLWYQMGDNINTGSPQSSGDNGRAMKLNADGTIVAIGAWQGNNNTGDVTIYKYDNINNIWN